MLALVGGASGCSLWRVWQPFALLSRVGYRAFWEFVGGNPEGERERLGLASIPEDVVRDVLSGLTSLTDAVILPRMGWMPKETPRMRRFLQALRNVGNVLIYEADDDIFSPWIVEQAAARRPFADRAALHAAMMGVIRAAPEDAQLALIRAHPDLAGKAARAGTMTRDSVREQAGAGLVVVGGDGRHPPAAAADHRALSRTSNRARTTSPR